MSQKSFTNPLFGKYAHLLSDEELIKIDTTLMSIH